MQSHTTFLIATYNAAPYIRETLESVFAQSLPAERVIVVDDKSTDDTVPIVREMSASSPVPVELVCLDENTGTPAEPTNIGIQKAGTQYIAILDQDDVCLPERLQKQVAYLDAHPECVAVGGAAVFSDPELRPLGVREFCRGHDAIDAVLLMKPGELRGAMLHPAMLVRRDALQQIGGYRTEFRASYDRDLMLRLAEVGRLENLDSLVLRYRLHATSFSHQRWRDHQQFSVRAVREAYERRGLAAPDEIRSTITSREGVCDSASWASMAIRGGNFRTARIHALQALMQQPCRLRSYKLAARAILGKIGERAASFKRDLFAPVGSAAPAAGVPITNARMPGDER